MEGGMVRDLGGRGMGVMTDYGFFLFTSCVFVSVSVSRFPFPFHVPSRWTRVSGRGEAFLLVLLGAGFLFGQAFFVGFGIGG